MKTKSVLFSVFIISSFFIYGKINAAGTTLTTTEGDKTPFDYSKANISQTEIFNAIDDIYNKMKRETADKPLYPTQFGGFAGTIDFYCKYPRLEKETNVSKAWFEKLRQLLFKMAPLRTNMKIAKMNKDNKLYAQCLAEYDVLFKEFERLYKNPEKIKK